MQRIWNRLSQKGEMVGADATMHKESHGNLHNLTLPLCQTA